MKNKLTKIMAMVSFLFAILLIPSVCGLAAGDEYTSHWYGGQEPTEVISGDYRIASDGTGSIGLTKGKKTVRKKISCLGSILYGSRDFYYVDQPRNKDYSLSSKAVVYRMDFSGKQKKIAVVSKVNGMLILGGEYKKQVYCYTTGGTIYKISVNSGKVKQIYAGKKYISLAEEVTSGKYLFCKTDEGDLIRVDMASGKAGVVVKKSTDQLWKSKKTVYISTTTGNGTDISSSMVKKFSTKSKKFVKETQIKKARVRFANDQIIVSEKAAEDDSGMGYPEYYLTVRKSGKKINMNSDEYWDAPVIIGNNCYYITYNYSGEMGPNRKYSSTLWKLSLKTGKKTRIKTVKENTLRFNGNKAGYLDFDHNMQYVYISLK